MSFLFLVHFVQPLTQSSGDFITHATKRFQLILFGSLDGGRIIEGPVESLTQSGENLWAVPLGVLAHDDQIMGSNFAEILLYALGSLAGNVNADLLHDGLDHRVDTVGI